MLPPRTWLIPILVGTLGLYSSCAWGQLFGARTVGQPLTGRSTAGVGELQGNERYVRGNRGREFVGSDRRDTQNFVGNEQGRTSGSLISSLAGLRQPRDRTAELNRPLAPTPRSQLYPPRLRIDAIATANGMASSTDLGQQIVNQLQQVERWTGANRLEVSVVDRTAILRGVVTSAAERDLAEILVLFEPGIYQVRNELAVLSK